MKALTRLICSTCAEPQLVQAKVEQKDGYGDKHNSSKAPRLAVDEDTLASQVLEIIGGITREALQTLEEPDEKDVWLMEEGDDSVFYSDEDQVHQDITTCGFGANGCKPLVNSVADVEEEPGEEYITDKESSELKEELNQHVIVDEQKRNAKKAKQ
ncbi:hypothetical protein F7725_001933 [Dissostichus mawsoni]|uniref:Uncharacterized protein n=1 Tax=Dissostichus mawsoni TaxID=36200 RepID=A0A7J5Y0Z3_DISMA|nr:hypothetical protein F7725_001933 [Dissostichus mawsoni]